MKHVGLLSRVLENFCERENLVFMSADELMFEDGVSEEQKDWLFRFVNVWEGML
jgi:hypothetical protein